VVTIHITVKTRYAKGSHMHVISLLLPQWDWSLPLQNLLVVWESQAERSLKGGWLGWLVVSPDRLIPQLAGQREEKVKHSLKNGRKPWLLSEGRAEVWWLRCHERWRGSFRISERACSRTLLPALCNELFPQCLEWREARANCVQKQNNIKLQHGTAVIQRS